MNKLETIRTKVDKALVKNGLVGSRELVEGCTAREVDTAVLFILKANMWVCDYNYNVRIRREDFNGEIIGRDLNRDDIAILLHENKTDEIVHLLDTNGGIWRYGKIVEYTGIAWNLKKPLHLQATEVIDFIYSLIK